MDVAGFLAWVGVGLALSVTVLSAGSFAPLLVVTVPATLGLAVYVYNRYGLTAAAFGLGPGFAVVWLVLAYTNRHGPGLHCHSWARLPTRRPSAATSATRSRSWLRASRSFWWGLGGRSAGGRDAVELDDERTERAGFEPAKQVAPAYAISSRAP